MLVLGSGPRDSLIPGMSRAGPRPRAKTHVVAETGDIVPAVISGTSAIGIAESTSAARTWPPGDRGAVRARAAGVTSRRVSTEVVGAPRRS